MTVNDIIFQLLREALFCQDGTLEKQINEGNTEYTHENETREDINNRGLWENAYDELMQQAVLGLTAPVVSRHREIPEDIRTKWSGMQRIAAIRYVQMADMQSRTCRLLQSAGIPVAVMKGMAAAIYYPVPENRAMGDVDLLVKPEDFEAAKKVLRDNGYDEKIENDIYHTAFIKYEMLIELHQSPAGLHRTETAEEIHDFILSGMDSIEMNEIGQDRFPILPWKQNGMELIWHIRQHLYNGLGLRQIIDWMMFVNYYLDDEHMQEYMPDLKKCGLDQLAITVTKMCQKYLGLPHENITWCDKADEGLCNELLDFIMAQGNFGIKSPDEKTAKVISGYSSPVKILKKLQDTGKSKWKLQKKYPILTPFAFLYAGFDAARTILNHRKIKEIIGEIKSGYQRKKLFSRLYGKRMRGKQLFFRRHLAVPGAGRKKYRRHLLGSGKSGDSRATSLRRVIRNTENIRRRK